jgi:Rrf2 family iron-sulfur cluster assembly transcriptional regulator
MLTQTGLYALQALLHLSAQEEGVRVPAGSMAESLSIPSGYLAKILHRLTREGLLESARGPGGGYRLLRDPSTLSVADAVAPFQHLKASSTCLLGGPCDPDAPCTAHRRRAAWNDAILDILKHTTLADLLDDPASQDLPHVSTYVPEKAL